MRAQTEKTKSAFSSADLSERAIQRRAVEAFIWGNCSGRSRSTTVATRALILNEL